MISGQNYTLNLPVAVCNAKTRCVMLKQRCLNFPCASLAKAAKPTHDIFVQT